MKLALLCAALALFGCAGANPDEIPGSGDDGPAGGNGDGSEVPVDVESIGEADPVGEIEAGPAGRATRRMSVDMLQASVPVVAGTGADGEPIRWAVKNAVGNPRDGFAQDVFGGTLGKPDYWRVTDENTLPSPLYVKLMDDMARNVCDQIVAADAAQSDASKRVLSRFAGGGSEAEVAKNVKYLVLRMLGESVEESDERVAVLAEIYEKAAEAASGAEAEGWRAVCIALVSSPAFHIY